MIITTMTRMFSHMEDLYFETAEMIDNDLIVAILFALLFVLFILYTQLTFFELGIFYALYRAFLIGIEEYKKYNNDLDSYEKSLYTFNYLSEDADDEEEDDEIKSYDLLNFELKELKMKKKE